MMPLQIYLRPRVTSIFDLLVPKSITFYAPARGPRALVPIGHRNRFVRFQNIAFTSLVTDEWTDARTTDRLKTLYLRLPV